MLTTKWSVSPCCARCVTVAQVTVEAAGYEALAQLVEVGPPSHGPGDTTQPQPRHNQSYVVCV